jgi:hypothetical protein
MSITMDSPILDVLETYPRTIEVFRKYGMGQIEDPSIRAMAAGASLDMAAGFLNLSQEQRSAMLDELNAVAQG